MSPWHEDVEVSSVVHLLLGPQGQPGPPVALQLRRRPGRTGRYVALGLALLGVVACGAMGVLLWTADDSPGAWFNAIFTVMLLVLGVGVLAGVASWHDDANAEERARSSWSAGIVHEPVHGRVVDRHVSTSAESGRVTRFVVQVESAAGSWRARWHNVDDEGLLQSQVPGIGSPARIWVSSHGPVVVELTDPTVVVPPEEPRSWPA